MSEAPGANGGGGAGSVSRDFATAPDPPPTTLAPTGTQQPAGPNPAHSQTTNRGSSRVHYALSIDPNVADTARAVPAADAATAFVRSDPDFAFSPSLRRRPTRAGTFRIPNRAGTFKTVDDFQDFTVRPGWHRAFSQNPLPITPFGLAGLTSATCSRIRARCRPEQA